MKTKVITKKCHVLNAKCQLLQLIVILLYVPQFDEAKNYEEAFSSSNYTVVLIICCRFLYYYGNHSDIFKSQTNLLGQVSHS